MLVLPIKSAKVFSVVVVGSIGSIVYPHDRTHREGIPDPNTIKSVCPSEDNLALYIRMLKNRPNLKLSMVFKMFSQIINKVTARAHI